MPFKDNEIQKAYLKEYRQKNKEKIKQGNKEYYDNNKQKVNEYNKEYRKTDKGKKSIRISHWKNWGIIFHDYNWLYDLYIARTHCDYCKNDFKNDLDRHLDHDHSINDDNNVRAILCRSCNSKDVLK